MRMITHPFQSRINFSGNLDTFLEYVVQVYSLGDLQSFRVIENGYEDFNISLHTDTGNYFLKIFEKDRTASLCEEYIQKIQSAIANGVPHPKLYPYKGTDLCKFVHSEGTAFMCLMEFIYGSTFYELGTKPTPSVLFTVISSQPILYALLKVSIL